MATKSLYLPASDVIVKQSRVDATDPAPCLYTAFASLCKLYRSLAGQLFQMCSGTPYCLVQHQNPHIAWFSLVYSFSRTCCRYHVKHDGELWRIAPTVYLLVLRWNSVDSMMVIIQVFSATLCALRCQCTQLSHQLRQTVYGAFKNIVIMWLWNTVSIQRDRHCQVVVKYNAAGDSWYAVCHDRR